MPFPLQSERDAMIRRIGDVVARIEYRQDRRIDYGATAGGAFIEIVGLRPDTYTGELNEGRGGRRFFGAHISDDQLVRLVFGALMAYEEHELREAFRYLGRRIFGPHITVDALLSVADQVVP